MEQVMREYRAQIVKVQVESMAVGTLRQFFL